MNKENIKTTLDWIKDVRKGCQDVLKKDAVKVLEFIKKGKFEAKALQDLLEEIKEQERDDALLSLIQKMLEEDYTKENKGVKNG